LYRKRRKLSNAAPPVVELPATRVTGDDDNAFAKSLAITMAATLMQTEVPATTATSAVIELSDAQRLSDATVQEWFARRLTADAATLLEDVDKRLVMMIARKKLAESQQALAKTCVADAVALAISLTLFK
jgi:hypothetical protein